MTEESGRPVRYLQAGDYCLVRHPDGKTQWTKLLHVGKPIVAGANALWNPCAPVKLLATYCQIKYYLRSKTNGWYAKLCTHPFLLRIDAGLVPNEASATVFHSKVKAELFVRLTGITDWNLEVVKAEEGGGNG